ncbi:MAG TPA: SepM family pheromone-processing serine protease [Bacillota bacterium]|nr:SepM family pheromone-processing serine protease [Bacillota bacterium]
MKKNRRIFWGFALIAAIFLVLNIPVPYYIERPGSAIPLAPMVEVEGGFHDEKGSLNMTTVRMGPASIGRYLYALVDPNSELVHSEYIHSPHESNEQYTQRQLEVMKASQDTAKVVAFQKAGYQFPIQNNGAMVMQLLPGYAAEQVLKIGDIIVEVEEKEIHTATELVEALKGRSEGDKVKIEYLREGKKESATLEMKLLPGETQEGKKKAGIGIASPVTHRQFILPKNVIIKSEDIGGPSAGLMFTLEMINQLTQEDITKGYHIAGTGTINEDGTIGPIGGITHKIVAAQEQGAEIFLAPATSIEGEKSNYEEAVEKEKSAGLSIKLVPVKNVDDALNYLKTLTPKS